MRSIAERGKSCRPRGRIPQYLKMPSQRNAFLLQHDRLHSVYIAMYLLYYKPEQKSHKNPPTLPKQKNSRTGAFLARATPKPQPSNAEVVFVDEYTNE